MNGDEQIMFKLSKLYELMNSYDCHDYEIYYVYGNVYIGLSVISEEYFPPMIKHAI